MGVRACMCLPVYVCVYVCVLRYVPPYCRARTRERRRRRGALCCWKTYTGETLASVIGRSLKTKSDVQVIMYISLQRSSPKRRVFPPGPGRGPPEGVVPATRETKARTGHSVIDIRPAHRPFPALMIRAAPSAHSLSNPFFPRARALSPFRLISHQSLLPHIHFASRHSAGHYGTAVGGRADRQTDRQGRMHAKVYPFRGLWTGRQPGRQARHKCAINAQARQARVIAAVHF